MAKIYHADLWGTRKAKYRALLQSDRSTIESTELQPGAPFYLFKPQDVRLNQEYQQGWKVTEAIPVNGVGMTTARDHLVIDFAGDPLLQRARFFRDSQLSNGELCRALKIPAKKGWDITRARKLLRAEEDLRQFLKAILYRPFDKRLIFYHDSLVWRTVKQVMRHMLAGENLALISARSNKSQEMDHFFASRHIMETKCGESTTQSCLFPLYVYPDPERPLGEKQTWPPGEKGRVPNLNPKFVADMESRLRLKFVSDGLGDLTKTFGPEDIFHYIYAIFHSPTYRKRYAEFLKIDFPRVPLTSDRSFFRALCRRGADLVSLHLLEHDYAAASWTRAGRKSPLAALITRYPVPGDNVVEKGHPRYVPPSETPPDEKKPIKKGRVYISKDNKKTGKQGQYLEGVPPEVWDFHVGGYQVCQKWLKDRRERTLSYDDLIHYREIIVALKETIRLMAEIDAAIREWPIK